MEKEYILPEIDCIIPVVDEKLIGNALNLMEGEKILNSEDCWYYSFIYLHGVLHDIFDSDQCFIYGRRLISYLMQVISNEHMVNCVSNVKLYHDGIYRDVTLYIWSSKNLSGYKISEDDELTSKRVVKGLIVDPTSFKDVEFANRALERRPFVI